ncbi:hypothetical protein C3942_16950 [Solimonas fluminis]|uniref:Antitoxin Xre/MbcA/ParS-like toxin-binding domain-containing protein n=1 Tax=Solimonas fluminis TaxID=2086571 RepID=A0A2S5TCY4_9GAMM|nr:antitoxin Xre/MbcA/ParS toxin-binding domain-containing protein [Solimonas fluminis]PPE72737.1 hypothetical protein C3942_16950 [Solimonas fluminis]
MKVKAMARPGLVLDLMDQLREASEERGRWASEKEKLHAGTSLPKAQPADDLLVVAAMSCAMTVFRDLQAAQAWLTRECQALGFVRPLDLLAECDGFSRALAELVRLQKNIDT